MNGLCELPDAIKRYNSPVGTTFLHRHLEKHKVADSINYFEKFKVTGETKNQLINATEIVSIMDNRPMNFCDKKPGILQFANVLLKIGQCITSGRCIDAEDSLPCAKLLKEEIKLIGDHCREKLKKSLRQIATVGGGITCDGVKCEVTGKKFYEFLIHYIKFPSLDLGLTHGI